MGVDGRERRVPVPELEDTNEGKGGRRVGDVAVMSAETRCKEGVAERYNEGSRGADQVSRRALEGFGARRLVGAVDGRSFGTVALEIVDGREGISSLRLELEPEARFILVSTSIFSNNADRILATDTSTTSCDVARLGMAIVWSSFVSTSSFITGNVFLNLPSASTKGCEAARLGTILTNSFLSGATSFSAFATPNPSTVADDTLSSLPATTCDNAVCRLTTAVGNGDDDLDDVGDPPAMGVTIPRSGTARRTVPVGSGDGAREPTGDAMAEPPNMATLSRMRGLRRGGGARATKVGAAPGELGVTGPKAKPGRDEKARRSCGAVARRGWMVAVVVVGVVWELGTGRDAVGEGSGWVGRGGRGEERDMVVGGKAVVMVRWGFMVVGCCS